MHRRSVASRQTFLHLVRAHKHIHVYTTHIYEYLHMINHIHVYTIHICEYLCIIDWQRTAPRCVTLVPTGPPPKRKHLLAYFFLIFFPNYAPTCSYMLQYQLTCEIVFLCAKILKHALRAFAAFSRTTGLGSRRTGQIRSKNSRVFTKNNVGALSASSFNTRHAARRREPASECNHSNARFTWGKLMVIVIVIVVIITRMMIIMIVIIIITTITVCKSLNGPYVVTFPFFHLTRE